MDDNASTPPPPLPPVAPPPPPFTPPPVISAPTPSGRPRSGGRGWMILAVILFVLLGISLLSNLGSFAGSMFTHSSSARTRSTGPRLEEVIRQDNEASDKIAIIE